MMNRSYCLLYCNALHFVRSLDFDEKSYYLWIGYNSVRIDDIVGTIC